MTFAGSHPNQSDRRRSDNGGHDCVPARNPGFGLRPRDKPDSEAPLAASDLVGNWIVAAPRWLFLGVLVAAPWAYGSTPTWAVLWLNRFLFVVLALWIIPLVFRLRRPAVPRVVLALVVLILVQAWWMAGNAHFDFDPETFTFSAIKPLLEAGTGSIARSLSFERALGTTAMFGALLFVADLARRRLWRGRLLFTMTLAGVSLAALGIAQRLTHAPAILWQGIDAENFFATFRYHSNAGAFLNLTLPLVALEMYRANQRRGNVARWVWRVAYLLSFIAVISTASRAAGALACLSTLAIFIVLDRAPLPSAHPRHPSDFRRLPSPLRLAVATIIVGLVALATTVLSRPVAGRWWDLPQQVSTQNPRLLVDSVCLRMAAEAGWFGFGPATFVAAFPHFSGSLGDRASGVWLHAHNDYLETAIEWGWVGAGLLATLFGVALACLRRRLRCGTERIATWLSALALGTILLHAAVDFPFQIPSIQLYVATLLGILYSYSVRTDPVSRLGSETADQQLTRPEC